MLSLNRKQVRGLRAGVLLFGLEVAYAVLLLPFFNLLFGAEKTTVWLTAYGSVALVNIAYSSYYSPVIRNISAAAEAKISLSLASQRDLITRMRRVGCTTLAILQVGYLIYANQLGLGQDLIPTIVILFVAQYFRLDAFNRFALLNGMREVGLDKSLLLSIGVAGLALVGLTALLFKNLLAPAIAILGMSMLLLHFSAKALRAHSGKSHIDNASAFPSHREQLRLVLVNGSGFLNMGTDVLLAVAFLVPAAAVHYSILSKAASLPVAGVGLLTQVLFPFWASSRASPAFNVRPQISPLVLLIALTGIVAAGGSVALLVRTYLATISPIVVVIVVLNACCAVAIVALGQYLIARGEYSFARNSIILGACAPAAGYGMGALKAELFPAGYLLINLSLLIVHTRSYFDARSDAI